MGASRVIFLVSACVCSRKQSAGHPPYELWLVCTRHEALKVSPLLLLLPLLHAPCAGFMAGMAFWARNWFMGGYCAIMGAIFLVLAWGDEFL